MASVVPFSEFQIYINSLRGRPGYFAAEAGIKFLSLDESTSATRFYSVSKLSFLERKTRIRQIQFELFGK